MYKALVSDLVTINNNEWVSPSEMQGNKSIK